jgi:hypothetical protein
MVRCNPLHKYLTRVLYNQLLNNWPRSLAPLSPLPHISVTKLKFQSQSPHSTFEGLPCVAAPYLSFASNWAARALSQMEPHSQDFEPEEPQPPKIDADGNVCLDRIFNEDGKPKQEYPLPPHKADRRNDFENALMNAYMTKKAAEDGTEPPPRKYQSEVHPPLRAGAHPRAALE